MTNSHNPGYLSDPEFWTHHRITAYENIKNLIPESGNISERVLTSCISKIKNIKFLARDIEEQQIHEDDAYSIMVDIINYLNLTITTNSTAKIKHKRPLVIGLPEDARYIKIIDTMITQMWELKNIKHVSYDFLVLVFTTIMMSDGGFGPPLMPTILSRFRLCDITSSETVLFPLSEKDYTHDCCEIMLPNSARTLLTYFIRNRREKEKSNEFVFFPAETHNTKRKKLFTSNIKNEYEKFASHFTNKTKFKNVPSFREFLRLAPQLSLAHSIPPFLLTLQSRTPLPATGKWYEHESYFTGQAIQPQDIDHPFLVEKSLAINPTAITTNKPKMTSPPTFNPNWLPTATKIYNDFITDLENLKIKFDRRPSANKKAELIYEKYIAIASKFTDSDSILHLSLDWTLFLLTKGGVKVTKSLNTYFSKFLTQGIFNYKHANSLKYSSQKSLNNFLQHNLDNRNLKADTQNQVVDGWFRIFKYACANNYLDGADVNLILNKPTYTKRTDFIWLNSFQAHIQYWLIPYNHNKYIIAILAELLMYTGCRINEILSLEFRDIIIDNSECYIMIRDGKSENARRIIPLHLFAPADSVRRIAQYWHERHNLCNNVRNPFFGPRNEVGGYKEKSITKALSVGLKQVFGESITPHSLRHSFATTIIARVMAIYNHEILDDLPIKDNELFSEERLDELASWLADDPEAISSGTDSTVLWQAAKLIGHATPETLLYTYTHIFPYIQKTFYRELNKDLDAIRIINKKASAYYVTNMKSPTSQSAKNANDLILSKAVELSWKNV